MQKINGFQRTKSVKKISIVGGGTAGLISALILHTRFPDKNIQVIKSDNIGIIGVGEGTTEHWREFMNFCDITPDELIKECDATIKMGVMFEGWTEKPYYHDIPAFHINHKFGQYLASFGLKLNEDADQVKTTHLNYEDNKINLSNIDDFVINQFHFNTFKLNEFLLKKCKSRGIEIFEDEIIEVEITNSGIDSLVGKKQVYKSDFYIDGTLNLHHN